MRVLVITPTLGKSRWLDETMASVARQQHQCRHVLVAPAEAVDRLAARFPGAMVVGDPAPARGMYAAINRGANSAPDDWDAVTYINDDDLLLPGSSTAAAAIAAAARAAFIAYGRVRLIDGAGRRLGAIPVSPRPSLNRALYAQRIEPVYQHGTLISRAAWDRLGGFDESLRYCGDSELLARACVLGIPFVMMRGREVAAFRLRSGQLTKNRAWLEEERRRVDAKLDLLAPRLTFRHRWARLAFRLANAPVYLERLARHGPVSFDELLARAG